MKLADVRIGDRYVAKVSGRLTVVRVLAVRPKVNRAGAIVWRVHVQNLRTRRFLKVSPARLRAPVTDSVAEVLLR